VLGDAILKLITDFSIKEVNRVLKPGGAVEIIEDGNAAYYSRFRAEIYAVVTDILFPVLPKWFTTPLRSRAKRTTSVHYPNGARPAQVPTPVTTPPPENHLPHDHALLEALYNSVFANRFINMRPSGKIALHTVVD
jgi:hypothetical protein